MRKILLFLVGVVAVFGLSRDANITSGTLKNGLKYYIKENSLPKNIAHFELVVRAGSADELDNELGLAHFTEHMAFNGSRDFSKNDLIKQLESLGVEFGADLNAQTSYDYTSYNLKITVNESNLNDVFKVYRNWMDGISFDAGELDKERGVVMAEERTRNTPNYRLYKQRGENMLKGSIYEKREPIGDMNIIKNVDVATIRGFYERVYQPRLMEFVAVGDFKTSDIVKLIEQNFGTLKNTNEYVAPNKTIPPQTGLNIYNYDSKETGINSIRINFFDKFLHLKDEASMRQILLNSYIANLLDAFYDNKSENDGSLLRASFSTPDLQMQKSVYGFESNVVNLEHEAAIKDMLSVIEGIKKHGFNGSDFENVKKKFISSTQSRYLQSKTKKSHAYMREILNALEEGSVMLSEFDRYDLTLKMLENITLDEVNAEFRRILSLPNLAVELFSSNGYKLDAQNLAKFKASVKPYDIASLEKQTASSLIQSEITPKKIVKKEFDKRSGIYFYTLQNGVTAILKPLKTQKNFISFAALSKGGNSNLSDPKHGNFAMQLSNLSGVGKFNNYELNNILSGKNVNYERRMSLLYHGFFGNSSSDDIGTLLEAVYLEFSEPRFDEKILERIKNLSIESLKRTQNLPRYKFNKEFIGFYYANNPRMMPSNEPDIKALKFDELKAITTAKFKNAAAFDFILVGDFEIEKIEPLLQKYVATLPSGGGSEKFVDDGVRSISGVNKFQRDYQTSQRSDVEMYYKNYGVKYSKQDAVRAQALSAVFSSALLEQIREEKGETYGFSVAVALTKHPYSYSNAKVGFTASPAQTQKVIDEVGQIVLNLKSQGAPQQHLQNYKKAAILKLKQNQDQPNFWMDSIISHRIYGEDLFDFATQERLINSVTNEDIKNAARLYLDEKNSLISINSPQK